MDYSAANTSLWNIIIQLGLIAGEHIIGELPGGLIDEPHGHLAGADASAHGGPLGLMVIGDGGFPFTAKKGHVITSIQLAIAVFDPAEPPDPRVDGQ